MAASTLKSFFLLSLPFFLLEHPFRILQPQPQPTVTHFQNLISRPLARQYPPRSKMGDNPSLFTGIFSDWSASNWDEDMNALFVAFGSGNFNGYNILSGNDNGIDQSTGSDQPNSDEPETSTSQPLDEAASFQEPSDDANVARSDGTLAYETAAAASSSAVASESNEPTHDKQPQVEDAQNNSDDVQPPIINVTSPPSEHDTTNNQAAATTTQDTSAGAYHTRVHTSTSGDGLFPLHPPAPTVSHTGPIASGSYHLRPPPRLSMPGGDHAVPSIRKMKNLQHTNGGLFPLPQFSSASSSSHSRGAVPNPNLLNVPRPPMMVQTRSEPSVPNVTASPQVQAAAPVSAPSTPPNAERILNPYNMVNFPTIDAPVFTNEFGDYFTSGSNDYPPITSQPTNIQLLPQDTSSIPQELINQYPMFAGRAPPPPQIPAEGPTPQLSRSASTSSQIQTKPNISIPSSNLTKQAMTQPSASGSNRHDNANANNVRQRRNALTFEETQAPTPALPSVANPSMPAPPMQHVYKLAQTPQSQSSQLSQLSQSQPSQPQPSQPQPSNTNTNNNTNTTTKAKMFPTNQFNQTGGYMFPNMMPYQNQAQPQRQFQAQSQFQPQQGVPQLPNLAGMNFQTGAQPQGQPVPQRQMQHQFPTQPQVGLPQLQNGGGMNLKSEFNAMANPLFFGQNQFQQPGAVAGSSAQGMQAFNFTNATMNRGNNLNHGNFVFQGAPKPAVRRAPAKKPVVKDSEGNRFELVKPVLQNRKTPYYEDERISVGRPVKRLKVETKEEEEVSDQEPDDDTADGDVYIRCEWARSDGRPCGKLLWVWGPNSTTKNSAIRHHLIKCKYHPQVTFEKLKVTCEFGVHPNRHDCRARTSGTIEVDNVDRHVTKTEGHKYDLEVWVKERNVAQNGEVHVHYRAMTVEERSAWLNQVNQSKKPKGSKTTKGKRFVHVVE
ncbi:hypothetical protein CVT24_001496 [Panaeolus cyanescens]|uniref:C2H2-type domain-containing protein n=1 Tax=Panaeolus cyanescens TaxID=181874 RepID=A0A409W2Z8_9AGAR|nr:hypothetical protein CVT24_001496 [Panaeolus cyanescens]